MLGQLMLLVRRQPERVAIVFLFACLVYTTSSPALSSASSSVGASIGLLGQQDVQSTRTQVLLHDRPQKSFRANLLPEHGYVTAFPYGGTTNQLYSTIRAVYIARRTQRAALLPELWATHEQVDQFEHYGHLYDLDGWSRATNVSIVEWREIKVNERDPEGGADVKKMPWETLSCWGWAANYQPLGMYHVNTSFWPPPEYLTVQSSIERSMTPPAIEVLLSQSHEGWLKDISRSWFHNDPPPRPDERIFCFQHLFYMPSVTWRDGLIERKPIEEFTMADPVWVEVGQHLRWSQHISSVGDELLAHIMGSASQPFIAVHLRQGDFVNLGRVQASVLEPYETAVLAVQSELRQRLSLRYRTLPILYATDSKNPEFIKRVNGLGWQPIDHLGFDTLNRFTAWYPGMLDSYVLSKSTGFVGTKMSTFSHLAAIRVETWNSGISRVV